MSDVRLSPEEVRRVCHAHEGVDYRNVFVEAKLLPDIVLERYGPRMGQHTVRVSIPQRFVYHSPTGFEWGYGGSGPADLALNILALVVPAPEAWRIHHDYKQAVIARIPDSGATIRIADVITWVTAFWGREDARKAREAGGEGLLP